MNVLSAGTSELAHGVHYGVLVVGVLGLLALIGPRWVGAPSAGPIDEHELRVAALRARIAAGSLGTTTAATTTSLRATADPTAALVPLVIVSSTAAAGVHSAVAPSHLGELALFGLFFIGSAVLQLAWSVLMVLRPTRDLLVAGVVLNAALLALWALTRTVGLPFGLLPSPEAVGPWDLTCAAWEVVVVVLGARAAGLSRGRALRAGSYDTWPTSARLWLLGSVTVLGALTLSGASA